MTGKRGFLRISLIIIAAVLINLTGGAVLAAGEPEFRLDIDSLKLTKGVSSNLVLTMTNAKGAELTGISGMEDFGIISRGTSTSTVITNGRTTYEEATTYVIMPKKTGEFTIRGSVKFDGKTYETNELKLNVEEADNASQGEAQELFIKTILSDNEIYLGQKVVLAYELYTRYNIENFGFLEDTGIDGFISTDLPEEELNSEITYIGGDKYARYETKQSFMVPIKSGSFTIPAFNFQANVGTGGFFSSSKPYYLQTEEKVLTVKPLPQDNKPKDFSGIVGKLDLSAEYSKKELNYGESMTLKVTASGNCNLDGLKEIVKGDIPGFTVYQTEKSFKEGIEDNKYKASKEFEIILVPKEGGSINIDPIPISYFNTQTGSYEKAELQGATILVNGGPKESQTGGAAGPTANTAVETVRIDQVSYIADNKDYLTIQMRKVHLYMVLAILAILLILAATAFFLIRHMGKQDKVLKGMYKQLLKSEDRNEIYSLFSNMLKHRFNISLKSATRSEVAGQLKGSRLMEPVLEIMDYMEAGKFKGISTNNIEIKAKVKDIYNEAKRYPPLL